MEKKKKTTLIKNWKELISLVDNINSTTETIIMVGWVHKHNKANKKTHIFFKTVPIETLKQWYLQNE